MTTTESQATTRSLSKEGMLNRISIGEPYFALDDLARLTKGGEEIVSAIVPRRQQPMGSEQGCMAAAEVGRHLAILGSCAAALRNQNEGQHFYLASAATLTAHDDYLRLVADRVALDNGRLMGFATARFPDKRSAAAHARLVYEPTGQQLFDLDVTYQCLKPRLFERFFAEGRVEDESFDVNAYCAEVEFTDEVCLDDLFSARSGPFDPSRCAGHFPGYPAVPVAIIMYMLSRSAGSLLNNNAGKQVGYGVKQARVKAENLAFAHETLHIVTQYKDRENPFQNDKDRVYRCRALKEGNAQKLFGEMELILRCLDDNFRIGTPS